MNSPEFDLLIEDLLSAHIRYLQNHGKKTAEDVIKAKVALWESMKHRELFYILETRQGESVINNQLVWYRPKACGYTMYLSAAGKFTAEEAAHRHGSNCRAIPCDFVDRLAELTVPNERENFKRCINAAMPLQEPR